MEPSDGRNAPPGNELVVEVAVKFLNNPKVKDSDLSTKKAFLKKKGLSDGQIEEAIRLAALQTTPARGEPVPGQTRRSYLLRFVWNAVIVGGVAYTAAYVFRWYVLPWFQGGSPVVEQLGVVNSSLTELNNNLTLNLTKLSDSNASMQQSLLEQQSKLEQVTVQLSSLQASSTSSQSSSLNEIKTELSSIKGLLVNKNQFASPRKEAGIPAWQRSVEESGNTTVQNDTGHDNVEEPSDS